MTQQAFSPVTTMADSFSVANGYPADGELVFLAFAYRALLTPTSHQASPAWASSLSLRLSRRPSSRP